MRGCGEGGAVQEQLKKRWRFLRASRRRKRIELEGPPGDEVGRRVGVVIMCGMAEEARPVIAGGLAELLWLFTR